MARRKSFVLLVCVLVLLLLACGGSVQYPRPLHSEFGAQCACEKFVKARLKTTGARFTFSYDSETLVHYLGDGSYEVIGYVDVQDRSGAIARSSYVCRVSCAGKRAKYNLNGLVTKSW